MKTTIIKYALSNTAGLPVYIRDAQNGIACNCVCAKCQAAMSAIQGEKMEWHFRHHIESDCSGGFETALHKLAKQIIVENSQINIPGQTLYYFNARPEQTLGKFVPDVTVSTNEFDVHFEIVVRNDVEPAKASFYKSEQHKSIKIDLSDISYDITPSELKKIVLEKVNNKSTLFWEADKAPTTTQQEDITFENVIQAALVALGVYLLFRIFRRVFN